MPQQAFQKEEETGADPEARSQYQIVCPVTGEQAKKLAEDCMAIPKGQANWWLCSACRGWHLEVEDKHSRPSEISQ